MSGPDELVETLLHSSYVGLVALQADKAYRWAAAGLFVLSCFHLWRHRKEYSEKLKALRWFKRE